MATMKRRPNEIYRPVLLHVRSGLKTTEHETTIFRIEREHIVLDQPRGINLADGQEVTIHKETRGGDVQEYQTTVRGTRHDSEEERQVIHGTIPAGFAFRGFVRQEILAAVVLTVEGQESGSKGNLISLSGNGAAVAVELVEPERPEREEIAQVQFTLPRLGSSVRVGGRRGRYAPPEPAMDEFNLIARVVRRHQHPSERRLTVLGLQFDQSQFVGTTDNEEQHEKIVRYLLQVEFQKREQRDEDQ